MRKHARNRPPARGDEIATVVNVVQTMAALLPVGCAIWGWLAKSRYLDGATIIMRTADDRERRGSGLDLLGAR